jgi:hypothetical protein
LAASIALAAISAGVTGTAGFFSGVGAEPVTAHEIIVGCIQLFSIQTDNKIYLKIVPQKKASAKAGCE